MQTFRIVLAIALLVSFSSCVSTSSTEAPIYRAVFEQFNEPNRVYLVREMPPRPAMPDVRTREFENLRMSSPHVADDFAGARVQLLAETEYQQLFSDGCDGKAFHSRYPDAKVLLALSHVSFRSSHEAAVYAESSGHCLGGSGVLFILENASGRWRVKEQDQVWVS